MSALLDLFPGARFLFIRRNPYRVSYSTFHLWKRTLLPNYTLQRMDEADVERFVLTYYQVLMTARDAQSPRIPAGQLAEVRHEDLTRDPLETLRDVFPRLGLEFGPRLGG